MTKRVVITGMEIALRELQDETPSGVQQVRSSLALNAFNPLPGRKGSISPYQIILLLEQVLWS